MMNPTASPASPRLHWSAIGAGILTFIALYVLLGLVILFALVFLSERAPSVTLYGSFKIIGLASWAAPGYIAAGQRGWLHGALTGIGVGALVTASMMFTFSWEGSVNEQVRDSMLKTFTLAWLLCTLAGALADIIDTRSRRRRARA
jgi:hypothetical protein